MRETFGFCISLIDCLGILLAKCLKLD
uniref:Uncharacterized protein n=1 Tax=Arundo donax TaxID=35708 RepID=A0A0A9F6V2_ARUDO